MQVQVSNHLKLLRPEALVVSVEEKAYKICQVWITKVSVERTNVRIEISAMVSKLEACPSPKISRGGTCVLPRWHPVSSWHERDPGSGAERGNAVCDAKRKPYKCDPRTGKVSMRMQGADHPVVVRNLV